MDTYKVYIKTNENNLVTAIEGGLYPPTDVTNWVLIDEGTQYPTYTHPQGNYLSKPLFDDKSCHNFKYVNGKVVETTDVEKQTKLAKIEKQRQIPVLKALLQETDYKVIKQSEATCASISPLPYTDEEIKSIYAERQALRNKINELEGSAIV